METLTEQLIREATRMPTILDMTLTSHDHPHTIFVTVEMEDGAVAYAEIDGHRDPTGLLERCYVTTASRSAHWEYGIGGDWKPAKEANVSLSSGLRRILANAARAGLVAAGRAS